MLFLRTHAGCPGSRNSIILSSETREVILDKMRCSLVHRFAEVNTYYIIWEKKNGRYLPENILFSSLKIVIIKNNNNRSVCIMKKINNIKES